MPSTISFRKLTKAKQNRVIQKQSGRVERDRRDAARFPDNATRKSSLHKEFEQRKKEKARLARLEAEAEAAIPEHQKNFWDQYRAAVNEGHPSKAEIKALLKTRGQMDIWPEVESIMLSHQSWIMHELNG